MLEHLSTTDLRKAHADLLHPIPGDPTFIAAVGALLRAMISHELATPGRVATDKQAAAETLAEREKAEPDLVEYAAEQTQKRKR